MPEAFSWSALLQGLTLVTLVGAAWRGGVLLGGIQRELQEHQKTLDELKKNLEDIKQEITKNLSDPGNGLIVRATRIEEQLKLRDESPKRIEKKVEEIDEKVEDVEERVKEVRDMLKSMR